MENNGNLNSINSQGFPATEDVLEINLSDILAQLFYKWVRIFLMMVIGTAVASALWLHASKGPKVERVTLKDIELARAELSEDKAQQAEYLFGQYTSYLEYRKSLQKYLSDSLYSKDDYAGNISLTTLYYIKSDIGNVNQIFTRLAVGMDEFEKIAQIMEKDETMLDDVYRRVSIADLSSFEVHNDEISYIVEDTADKEQKKMLLQVYLVAEDQEQADAVLKVIQDAFDRKLEELKAVDAGITMSCIGSNYSTNISDFLVSRQNDAVSNLNAINDEINGLQANYVDKLDSDTKEYYQLMKDRREQEITPVKQPSLIKYLVIGAFIGIVLAAAWIVLKYLLDGRIKIAREMMWPYYQENPDRVFRPMKGLHLFGGLARRCNGADLSGAAVQVDLAASDIGIKLEKQEKKSVYLVTDGATDWQKQFAQELMGKLTEREIPVQVRIGNPISDSKELEVFSATEAAVLIAELKSTRRTELQ